jgi:cell division protein FtsW (lipid II flippase)
MLFCYPIYTVLLALTIVGIIMIFSGSKTDKDGKTSYSTTTSIIGIILTVVSILAMLYFFMKK